MYLEQRYLDVKEYNPQFFCIAADPYTVMYLEQRYLDVKEYNHPQFFCIAADPLV